MGGKLKLPSLWIILYLIWEFVFLQVYPSLSISACNHPDFRVRPFVTVTSSVVVSKVSFRGLGHTDPFTAFKTPLKNGATVN